MTAASRTPLDRRRPFRRLATVLTAVATSVLGLAVAATVSGTNIATASPASADGSPVGTLGHWRIVPGGLRVRGWDFDPNAPHIALWTFAKVDGSRVATQTRANKERAFLAQSHPIAGTQHGFRWVVPVPEGEHKVCVAAASIGAGPASRLGCVTENFDYGPWGHIDRISTVRGGLHVKGWTVDSDNPAKALTTTISVDGIGHTLVADRPRPDIVAKHPLAGPDHGFAATYRARQGTHKVCVRVTNIGYGSNNTLGCSTVTLGPPPQRTPAPVSTSRYVRNISGSSSTDIAKMRREGHRDARANPSGHRYLILLAIGGQDQFDRGVVLSATTQFVSYRAVRRDLRAYVTAYHRSQRPNAPVTISFGTNNDMDVSAASGRTWARRIVGPLRRYASGYRGMRIAGSDDMEPGFRATYRQSHAWLRGYLSATRAPFVFNGSADGCSWTAPNQGCNNGWRMRGIYRLAAGAAPRRIVSLPQIYYNNMAAQWKYISLTGIRHHRPRIDFGGPLTEWTACSQAGSCGSLTGHNAWSVLWRNLQSRPRLKVKSLPYSTDLRIDR